MVESGFFLAPNLLYKSRSDSSHQLSIKITLGLKRLVGIHIIRSEEDRSEVVPNGEVIL